MPTAPVIEDTRTAAAAERADFSPPTFARREIDFPVAGHTHRFLLATQEAADWYDPPKPHAMLEYEFVANHVPVAGETVYDIGCHHGHYAMVLAACRPKKLVCVDAVAANCAITRTNLALNDFAADVRHLAVSTKDGTVEFTADTNGRVVERGVVRVPAARLTTCARDATVIKLDVEGEEFRLLPDQIDALPNVHTWVIEIHPWTTRDPHALMPLLTSRFSVEWVNRATMRVEPYPAAGADWSKHTTVICRRESK